MGLFSNHNTGDSTRSSKARDPPDLDRQRLLASTIGDPRAFMAECVKAQYDLQTMQACVRPPPAHAGMATLMGVHGGAWSKQEMAMYEIFGRLRLSLDSGYGEAKQCCDTDRGRSNPSMDDTIRDTATQWRELSRRWSDYKGSQNKQWAKITTDQVGQLAAQALGILT